MSKKNLWIALVLAIVLVTVPMIVLAEDACSCSVADEGSYTFDDGYDFGNHLNGLLKSTHEWGEHYYSQATSGENDYGLLSTIGGQNISLDAVKGSYGYEGGIAFAPNIVCCESQCGEGESECGKNLGWYANVKTSLDMPSCQQPGKATFYLDFNGCVKEYSYDLDWGCNSCQTCETCGKCKCACTCTPEPIVDEEPPTGWR